MNTILLGNEIINQIDRELANIICGSISNNDIEALSQQREKSSQENEIRDFSGEKTIPRQDGLFQNILK